ncbi:MAG: DUF123 domain-containing protein [Dehalococcoidia bacterium]
MRAKIGKLGTFSFPAGYYLYVGSAKGGLKPRLRRHLRKDKPLRWHIDYLRREGDIEEIWWSSSDEAAECSWRRSASKLSEARVLVKGFGSSDCRCPSHLIYFPVQPSLEMFRRRLPEVPIFRCGPGDSPG